MNIIKKHLFMIVGFSVLLTGIIYFSIRLLIGTSMGTDQLPNLIFILALALPWVLIYFVCLNIRQYLSNIKDQQEKKKVKGLFLLGTFIAFFITLVNIIL